MKRFTANLLLFLTCGILINYITYIFIAKPVLYNDYYPSSHELNTYKCFLLSDSHGNAIGKKDLSKIGIYNFSFNSDSYTDMILKLNFLINNAKSKTIFITVDDHTLSPYRKQMNNRPRSIRFCNKSLYKQLYGGWYINYIFEKYINPYFPLLNTNNSKLFYSFIISFIKNDNKKKKAKRQFSDLTPERKIKDSRKRMEYQFPKNANSTISKEEIKQIVLLCKRNAITLLGIKFPITKDYIEALGEKSYNADVFLKKRGVKVFDFKNIFTNKDYLFSDVDHLNQIGSKQFTLQLTKKCTENHIFCNRKY